MAMGQRTYEEQTGMWVAVEDLPRSVSHPFYKKLNRLLAEHGFDEFVETQCRPFYAEKMGRPSLAPGQYFRLLLLGNFECLNSERGIAWRAAVLARCTLSPAPSVHRPASTSCRSTPLRSPQVAIYRLRGCEKPLAKQTLL